MSSGVWRWLRAVFGASHNETEAETADPRTESERAVKAPLDEVPDITEDESGLDEES